MSIHFSHYFFLRNIGEYLFGMIPWHNLVPLFWLESIIYLVLISGLFSSSPQMWFYHLCHCDSKHQNTQLTWLPVRSLRLFLVMRWSRIWYCFRLSLKWKSNIKTLYRILEKPWAEFHVSGWGTLFFLINCFKCVDMISSLNSKLYASKHHFFPCTTWRMMFSPHEMPVEWALLRPAVLIYPLCSGFVYRFTGVYISFDYIYIYFLELGKKKKNWTGCTRVLVGWWTVMNTCWGAPLTNTFSRRWRRRRQAVLLRQDSSQALSLPHPVPIPFLTWLAKSGRTHSSLSGTDVGLGMGFCYRDA